MGICGGIIGGIIGTCIAPGWGTAIGVAIGAGAGKMFGNKDSGDVSRLNVRIERKFIPVDNDNVEVFEIQLKGIVVAPKDNTPADFLLVARDCTGGKNFKDGDDIAVSDNSLSSFGNGVLSLKEDTTLPYQYSEYSDWATEFIIPVSCLIFPYKGMRYIKFDVVVSEKNGNVLACAEEKISVDVTEIGYMEYEDYWKKAEPIALEIVRLLVFTNSKCFLLETSTIVKEWINSRVELRDENKEQTKSELNATFAKIKKTCKILDLSVVRQKACEFVDLSVVRQKASELTEVIRVSEKYSFMEFFIQIVASFENISDSDLRLLDAIALELELDDTEYQAAKHKYITMHEIDEVDSFVVLGIPKNLTAAEKKKKLRELFAKWNALAVHKDPKIQMKAEKMLCYIAECKKQLL